MARNRNRPIERLRTTWTSTADLEETLGEMFHVPTDNLSPASTVEPQDKLSGGYKDRGPGQQTVSPEDNLSSGTGDSTVDPPQDNLPKLQTSTAPDKLSRVSWQPQSNKPLILNDIHPSESALDDVAVELAAPDKLSSDASGVKPPRPTVRLSNPSSTARQDNLTGGGTRASFELQTELPPDNLADVSQLRGAASPGKFAPPPEVNLSAGQGSDFSEERPGKRGESEASSTTQYSDPQDNLSSHHSTPSRQTFPPALKLSPPADTLTQPDGLGLASSIPTDPTQPGETALPTHQGGPTGDKVSHAGDTLLETQRVEYVAAHDNTTHPSDLAQLEKSCSQLSPYEGAGNSTAATAHRLISPPEDSYETVDGELVLSKFVRPFRLVQEAHTSSEHLVYTTMYRLAGGDGEPPNAPSREAIISLQTIATRTAISRRNVRRIVKSLVTKLAVEVTEYEDKAKAIPRRYRVWGMNSILERRRRAGYSYIYRNRNQVTLARLWRPTDNMSPAPQDTLHNGTQVMLSADTSDNMTLSPQDNMRTKSEDKLSANVRKQYKATGEETTSSPKVVAAVHSAVGYVDDVAIRRIVADCRVRVHDATEEEIIWAIGVTAQRLRTMRNINNPTGLLIVQVPRCFEGEPFQHYRDSERQRREAERQQTLEIARQILSEPDAPESERIWALDVLREQ